MKDKIPQGQSDMGLTQIAVHVRGFGTRDTFTANFFIDTRATDSIVPACELKKIGIEPTGKKTYELSNGALEEYEVAFAEFSFMGDITVSRIIFGPDNAQPTLGGIALGSAGLVVDPVTRKLKKLPALPLKQHRTSCGSPT